MKFVLINTNLSMATYKNIVNNFLLKKRRKIRGYTQANKVTYNMVVWANDIKAGLSCALSLGTTFVKKI